MSRRIGWHEPVETPQYEDCEVLSPDGQLMFRCSQKKAKWYLDRDLATKISIGNDPIIIKLNFIPKGLGHADDPFYLQKMENRCVVCGIKENLTRHHIVPYCYRRFFPVEFKEHRAYDVLAICILCHRIYEKYADGIKDKLAVQYSSPRSGIGVLYDRNLGRARGYALAILTNPEVPLERRKQLLDHLEEYLQKEVTEEDLKDLINKDPYDYSGFIHHGKMVMDKIDDIESFIQSWRQHFLDKMQPQFLPALWTVNRESTLQSQK